MPGSSSPLRLGISAGACLGLALSLLVLPLRWILAAITAAAVHELFHGIAAWLLGGRIRGLRIGRNGAVLSVSSLTPGKELLCALAGPLGSSLLVLLYPWIPRISFCAMVHGVYNLLPIYPMDGGRVIHCALSRLSPDRQLRICRWAENLCLGIVFAGAFYAAVILGLGWTPLLVAGVLWIRAKSRNTPCKEADLALQ